MNQEACPCLIARHIPCRSLVKRGGFFLNKISFMETIIQFPVSDFRFLLNSETFQSVLPDFSDSSNPYNRYIRHFGRLAREQGVSLKNNPNPVKYYINNSVKFVPTLTKQNLSSNIEIAIELDKKGHNRLFESNGFGLSKAEIAFVSDFDIRPEKYLNNPDLFLEIIDTYTDLDVQTNKIRNDKTITLFNLNIFLAEIFLVATSEAGKITKSNKWLVSPCTPLIAVKYIHHDWLKFPSSINHIFYFNKYGVNLYHYSITKNNVTIPVWLIGLEPGSIKNTEFQKNLSDYILKTHLQKQCFFKILFTIRNKKIKMDSPDFRFADFKSFVDNITDKLTQNTYCGIDQKLLKKNIISEEDWVKNKGLIDQMGDDKIIKKYGHIIEPFNDPINGDPGKGTNVITEKKVFISYSHSDQEKAFKIKERLIAAGFEVVIDDEAMKAGEEIKKFIEESIKNTNVTVSLVSNKSLRSSWVSMETITTFSSEKFVADKKFIACYIDEDFQDPEFTYNTTKEIDKDIKNNQELIRKCQEQMQDTKDLDIEKSRLFDLRYHLNEIVSILRNRLSLDVRDDKFEKSMERLTEAIRN
jgi:hypothetical protein